MCDLIAHRTWRLCDGSGWKSTYHFRLGRYEHAALAVRPRLRQPALSELAFHLSEINEKRLAEKGKPLSEDHVKQEAVKWSRARI